MAVELAETKRQIFEYVESRMAFIAPNLSAIIGKSQRDLSKRRIFDRSLYRDTKTRLYSGGRWGLGKNMKAVGKNA